MARNIGDVEAHLPATGNPRLQIVLLGLPSSEQPTRLDIAATAASVTVNGVLRAMADEIDAVAYVEPLVFSFVKAAHPFTRSYYQQLGREVAGSLSGHCRRGRDHEGAGLTQ